MSHLVTVERHGKLIRVKVLGQLGVEAFKHILPFLDRAIEEHESARMLFDLTSYAGREPGEGYDDLTFDLPNWAAVERVAFIGDKVFEPRMPIFCKPFTSASLRWCYPDHGEDAEAWIQEGIR